jgi:hypothetical protein
MFGRPMVKGTFAELQQQDAVHAIYAAAIEGDNVGVAQQREPRRLLRHAT